MPITFYLQGEKRPTAIYVRFREGRMVDAKARTKFTVNPDNWSKAKGRAKDNDAHGKNLNWQLDNFRKDLSDRLNRRKPGERVDTEWLKEFIEPSQAGLSENLVEYYERYIQSKKIDINEGRLNPIMERRYRNHQNLLRRFQTDTNTDLVISSINLSQIAKFKEYCRKKSYAPNTIARSVKSILTLCRDARKHGLQTHPDIDLIKETTLPSKNVYLTLQELDKIQLLGKSEQLPDYLDNARDWLLISCFTGQRVSDFMRFTREMIHKEKGKTVLEFTQVKTKKVMTIPLHPKVEAILEKRKGEFPRAISDQRYNDYIKEVCKEAGIKEKIKGSRISKETNRKESGVFEKWELVSSHIGRRSFASNFFGTIPTSLLMFVTGHATESQFYAYIGKAERTKAFQLAEYW